MEDVTNPKLINATKIKIIDKLKYIFHDKSGIMKQFVNLVDNYKKCKTNNENEKNTEGKNDANCNEDQVLEEIKDATNKNLCLIFKKISLLFQALSELLKFIIIQVNDERYQKAIDEKIEFPTNVDQLIIVIGCYGDAFTQDMQEDLFQILEMNSFKEIYTIAKINHVMIPFVANDKIDIKLLEADYIKLSEVVKNFACDVLNVNTDFENGSIIECIDYNDMV